MNIFITGGTTGIGLEIAKQYALGSNRVGVCSFQATHEMTTLPKNISYYKADVRHLNELVEAVKSFVSEVGTLDVIIANAGINMPKNAIPDTKLGQQVIDINVSGVANTFSAAIPYFITQKAGHFVAMSSLSSLNGLPGMSYYGASKAFVASFCESLAIDLEQYGIYVTSIFPGYVLTGLTKDNSHPMPFLMNQDIAAKKIIAAIKKKKKKLSFPAVSAATMTFLRLLPRNLYFYLMKKDVFNLKHYKNH